MKRLMVIILLSMSISFLFFSVDVHALLTQEVVSNSVIGYTNRAGITGTLSGTELNGYLLDNINTTNYTTEQFDLSNSNKLNITFTFPYKGADSNSTVEIDYIRFRCMDIGMCPKNHSFYGNGSVSIDSYLTNSSSFSVGEWVTIDVTNTTVMNSFSWIITGIFDDDTTDNVSIADVEIYSTEEVPRRIQGSATGFIETTPWWNDWQWAYTLHIDDVDDVSEVLNKWDSLMPLTLQMWRTGVIYAHEEELVKEGGHEIGTHAADHVDSSGYTYSQGLTLANDTKNQFEPQISNTSYWSDNNLISFAVPYSATNFHVTEAIYDAGFRICGQTTTSSTPSAETSWTGHKNGTDYPRDTKDWMSISRALGSAEDGSMASDFEERWNYSRDNGLYGDSMAHQPQDIDQTYIDTVSADTTGWKATWGLVRTYRYYYHHTNLTYNSGLSNSTYKVYDIDVIEDTSISRWKTPVTFAFNFTELGLDVDNVVENLQRADVRMTNLTGIQRMNKTYSYGYRYNSSSGTFYLSIHPEDGDTIILDASSYSNTAPNVTLNSPTNGATGSISPLTLNITVTDPEADNMNVLIYSVTDDEVLESWDTVSNGTMLTYTLWRLEEGRTYQWYVNVSDYQYTTQGNTWSFTTDSDFGCLDLSGQNTYTLNNSATLCRDTYYMNTSSSSGAITIENTDGIILDCNGSTIIGNTSGYGVYNIWRDNITIKNCNLTNYNEGIYSYRTNNSVYQNNTFLNNTYGLYLSDSHHNVITRNTFRGVSSNTGIFFNDGDYNNISHNIISNHTNGMQIIGEYNNIFNNTIDESATYGIYMTNVPNNPAKFNDIYNNTIHNNKDGIRVYNLGPPGLTTNNTIRGNNITLNTQYGVYIGSTVSYSFVYNNLITSNTINARGSSSNHYWNTTRTLGLNIINARYIGGNYWDDYVGTDTDGDYLGDTQLPHNSTNNITTGGDYHPLVPDTDVPVRSNGEPTGTISTLTTTVSLSTDENATCKYSTNPNVLYDDMEPDETSWGTFHEWEVSTPEGSYTFYVRCEDNSNNQNIDDYEISFTVSSPSPGGGTPPQPETTFPPVPQTFETFPTQIVAFNRNLCLLENTTVELEGTGASVLLDGSIDEQGKPSPGSVAVLLYPQNSNYSRIGRIRCIEPQELAVVICNQTVLASYEVDVTSDQTYFCMNYEGYDIPPETIQIYSVESGDWLPIEDIWKDDSIICGNITGNTPYMIAGFAATSDSLSAKESVEAAESRITRAKEQGLDTSAAEQILKTAYDYYSNCNWLESKITADSIQFPELSQKNYAPVMIIAVIIILSAAGIYFYKK